MELFLLAVLGGGMFKAMTEQETSQMSSPTEQSSDTAWQESRHSSYPGPKNEGWDPSKS